MRISAIKTNDSANARGRRLARLAPLGLVLVLLVPALSVPAPASAAEPGGWWVNTGCGPCATRLAGVSYQGGINDNFALPYDSVGTLSPNLTALGGAWRSFDQQGANMNFGYTFWSLPGGIQSGSLTIRLQADPDIPTNDGISLQIDGTAVWGTCIGTPCGSPALYNGAWNQGTVGTFTIPLTPALVVSMNKLHRLDVYVEDDTAVDYVQLNITYCPHLTDGMALANMAKVGSTVVGSQAAAGLSSGSQQSVFQSFSNGGAWAKFGEEQATVQVDQWNAVSDAQSTFAEFGYSAPGVSIWGRGLYSHATVTRFGPGPMAEATWDGFIDQLYVNGVQIFTHTVPPNTGVTVPGVGTFVLYEVNVNPWTPGEMELVVNAVHAHLLSGADVVIGQAYAGLSCGPKLGGVLDGPLPDGHVCLPQNPLLPQEICAPVP